MTKPEEVAWAAGLFEGEGCFTHGGSLKTIPVANLTTSDLDVIERFHKIIGIGSVCKEKRNHKNPKWKDTYKWSVYGVEKYMKVLDLFSPFLGERRSNRAREILKEIELRKEYSV